MMQDRHQGLSPAFDLSRGAYFLDFALVPLAVTALLATCELAPGALLLGCAAWTLAEYWIHRLLFHGHTPFEPMHQVHHALPKDMIGVASWGTFAAFALVWWLCGAMFCAGVMLGYLAYCLVHVRIHHGDRTRFGRYLARMADHHVTHHRGGRSNFGVTSPLWDVVFGTNARLAS